MEKDSELSAQKMMVVVTGGKGQCSRPLMGTSQSCDPGHCECTGHSPGQGNCRNTGRENSECTCDVLGRYIHGTLSISLQCICDVLAWNTGPCPQCMLDPVPFVVTKALSKIYYKGLPSKPHLVATTNPDSYKEPSGPEAYSVLKELRQLGDHPLAGVWDHFLSEDLCHGLNTMGVN